MFADFFSGTYTGDAFSMFSMSHWTVLFGFFALILLLYRYRDEINKSSKAYSLIRYGLAVILILTELTLNIWYYANAIWDPGSTLPFQLCSITLFLCIFMLFTKSYKLYEIAYFTGLGGAGQAMLTPELFYPFPHYRFLHFFIAHMAIILACLFMTWVEGYRPTWKSIWKTFGLLNVYMVVVFGINKWTGGNYLFLAYKPANPSLLDFLGPYPWYIVSLEFVALALFFLLYAPFLFRRKSV
ncbi:TIGR02206 family membrane protein [Ammoniphilus sp. CFH 90114]|nr:TIGR02206 family membrane protein [Ammoniphilus sp. CFH 90114]